VRCVRGGGGGGGGGGGSSHGDVFFRADTYNGTNVATLFVSGALPVSKNEPEKGHRNERDPFVTRSM